MRKKMADVKRYILTGLRYFDLLPLACSKERKPGLASSSLPVLKNFPSKCVMSLKKWLTRCHTVCLVSTFSCPQW